ncbi:hypothetical protein [Streptomyces sp. NPDC054784]
MPLNDRAAHERGERSWLMMMVATIGGCSPRAGERSCCPVEPPKKESAGPMPAGAFVWLAAVGVVMVGGWLLIMWAGSTIA